MRLISQLVGSSAPTDLGSDLDRLSDKAPDGIRPHAYWFGEDQARCVVTAKPDNAAAILETARVAGVAATKIGVVGGKTVKLGDETPAGGY